MTVRVHAVLAVVVLGACSSSKDARVDASMNTDAAMNGDASENIDAMALVGDAAFDMLRPDGWPGTYADGSVVTGCDPSELTWRYLDRDHDGHGASNTLTGNHTPSSRFLVCPLDPNYADIGDENDNDDMRPTAYPGATERCDGMDNDTDGMTDGPAADAHCGSDHYCLGGSCIAASACTSITSAITGEITTSGVWCAPTHTITLRGTVTIASGVRIAVARGTTLSMAKDGSTRAVVNVYGALELHGSSDAPILVQSAEAEPARGDWEGFHTSLRFGGIPHLYADHATIRHASAVNAYDSAAVSLIARNSVIEENVVVNASFMDLRNTVLRNNGFLFSSASLTFAENCEMYGNGSVLGAGALWGSHLYIHDNALVFNRQAAGHIVFSRITHNTILCGQYNTLDTPPVAASIAGPFTLQYDLIADNGNGLREQTSDTGEAEAPTSIAPLSWTGDDWSYNTLCNNGTYDIELGNMYSQYARNNYWCASASSRIYDHDDLSSLGTAYFSPTLSVADPLTPTE